MGMYPQTVVPLTSDIHNHLRDNHAGQTEGVKLLKDENGDAVYFTANRDTSSGWNPDNVNTWEKNPVYSYKGDRYVRVTPFAYQNDATHKYNDTTANPENIGQVYVASGSASNYRWFKIEPIKWIILNSKNLFKSDPVYDENIKENVEISKKVYELYAADVLMGGIPFGVEYYTPWERGQINSYLNTEFYNQAFLTNEQIMIQQSTIYNNSNLSGDVSDTSSPEYNSNSNYLTPGGKNPTDQKIYLLSRYELGDPLSPYVKDGNKIFGAGDTTEGAASMRQVSGTDYARAHYVWLGTSAGKSYSHYWTRTANYTAASHCLFLVNPTGTIGSFPVPYSDYAFYGQRPALQLK